MLDPIICAGCFQPNEAERTVCWKCMHKLSEVDDHDYVRLFGLKGEWTKEDLRSAYRQLARKHHPDTNPGDRETEAYFKFINQAFERLSRLDGPPKPKTPVKTTPPNKLMIDSDNFSILQDFVKDNTTKKPAPHPEPPAKKGLSNWLSKLFGR